MCLNVEKSKIENAPWPVPMLNILLLLFLVHKYIILDEPLANLDMKFKLQILKILKNLLNKKVCVIIAWF